jgi:hypothetical protein
MRKPLSKLGRIAKSFPHAATLLLLLSTAFFLAQSETANAQVWVYSGFTVSPGNQTVTATCSTTGVVPADYSLFLATCAVTPSNGTALITSTQCPDPLQLTNPKLSDIPYGSPAKANPLGVCSIVFQAQPGVTYTINSGHGLWFNTLSDCYVYFGVHIACYVDPEGFYAFFYAGNDPRVNTQTSSITQEVTSTYPGQEYKLNIQPIIPVASSSAIWSAPCPTPTITSVSPGTWITGQTYNPVTITGTNFTTTANANAACPVTPVSITTPSGTVIAVSNVTVVDASHITATVTPPVGEPNEIATVTVGTVPNTATATVQIVSCPIPTTETTAFDGWVGVYGTWKQTISDSNSDNFSGYIVHEQDPGGGVDSCWWPGSQYDPWTTITGSTWTVQDGNIWGDDSIGWGVTYLTYYRLQGHAPCGATLYQQMQIQCSDGSWQNYGPVNTLQSSFTNSTVTSKRAGGTATRRY